MHFYGQIGKIHGLILEKYYYEKNQQKIIQCVRGQLDCYGGHNHFSPPLTLPTVTTCLLHSPKTNKNVCPTQSPKENGKV